MSREGMRVVMDFDGESHRYRVQKSTEEDEVQVIASGRAIVFRGDGIVRIEPDFEVTLVMGREGFEHFTRLGQTFVEKVLG